MDEAGARKFDARMWRRRAVPILACLVVAVYAWQTASAWRDEQQLYGERQPSAIVWRGGGIRIDPLTGTASMVGARATLHMNQRADTGVLLVEDLPMLQPGLIYRLWAVDAVGNVDATADFNAPYDSDGTFTVDVIAPETLTAYKQFFVTVEPADDTPLTPSGKVVMTR
jgi:hypothetical protein